MIINDCDQKSIVLFIHECLCLSIECVCMFRRPCLGLAALNVACVWYKESVAIILWFLMPLYGTLLENVTL